jgi:hypothetical protein
LGRRHGGMESRPSRNNRTVTDLQRDAELARDRGIAQAAEHAGTDWAQWAFEAMVAYLQTHEFLHVDEYWEWANANYGLPEGPSPRALGAVTRRCSNRGMMVKSIVSMPSVRSRMGPKPVWQSMIYPGERTHRFRGRMIPR